MKTDLEIQKDVMDELGWEPILKATEIGVAVKNGIVTLSGTVDSYNKKRAAEDAAKSVSGVRAVAEDIKVKVANSGKMTDAEIAEAILNALQWHASVPEEKIRVKVEKGIVTLEGDLEWEYQRASVRNVVENISGVTAINNNIKITPTVKTVDVKKRILSAFHRSATIDAGSIEIEVSGNKIILDGTVRSFAEKRDAENAAWLAPGVTKVENKLVIDPEIYA